MDAWIYPTCIPQDQYLEMTPRNDSESCVQRNLLYNTIHCPPSNVLPTRRRRRFISCSTQTLSPYHSYSSIYSSSSSSSISSFFSVSHFTFHICCLPWLPLYQRLRCQNRHHSNWAYLLFNHFIKFGYQKILFLGEQLGAWGAFGRLNRSRRKEAEAQQLQ